MAVLVKFEKLLRPLVPDCDEHGQVELAAEPGMDIAGLLNKFEAASEQTAFVILNGRQARFSDPVRDGDRVLMYSVISGG